MDHSFWTDFRT